MEVRVGALSPRIAVRNHLKRGLVLLHRVLLITNGEVHSEISANVKRWVDVYEVYLPAEFLEKGGHHQLVVAPDEPVSEIV